MLTAKQARKISATLDTINPLDLPVRLYPVLHKINRAVFAANLFPSAPEGAEFIEIEVEFESSRLYPIEIDVYTHDSVDLYPAQDWSKNVLAQVQPMLASLTSGELVILSKDDDYQQIKGLVNSLTRVMTSIESMVNEILG